MAKNGENKGGLMRCAVLAAVAILLCAATLTWVIGEKGGEAARQTDTAGPWEGATYETETD